MIPFTKEWIEHYPKSINDNGCWIPTKKAPSGNGYILVMVNHKQYMLHRVVLALYHNINYHDNSIVTRHNKDCSRSCFNPKHIQPGSCTDNNRDLVLHGKHRHAIKTVCPTCNQSYSIRINKSGPKRGQARRYCVYCNHNDRKRRVG